MEHLGSTHPINQHPSYDRYAEMTHFVNHTTIKSKSKSSLLNIDHVHFWSLYVGSITWKDIPQGTCKVWLLYEGGLYIQVVFRVGLTVFN